MNNPTMRTTLIVLAIEVIVFMGVVISIAFGWWD